MRRVVGGWRLVAVAFLAALPMLAIAAEKPDLCFRVQQDGTVLLQPDTASGYRWRETDDPDRLRLLFIDSRGIPDEAEYSISWESLDGHRRRIKPRPQPQPQPQPKPAPTPSPTPTPEPPSPPVQSLDLWAAVLENSDYRQPPQAELDLWLVGKLGQRYLRYDRRDPTLPESMRAIVAKIPPEDKRPWLVLRATVAGEVRTVYVGPEPATVEAFKELWKEKGGKSL